MEIDLVNDLRRDDDESDENDEKRQQDVSDDEQTKKDDVENVMKKANEVAKKKVARRPRPKLDVDRLIGPRGLEELTNLFKDEKFKGKTYEYVDLDTMMHRFEYWAHRLVPHMAFDDFIEKAEHLGSKKAIKNALQRLRDKLNIHTAVDDDKQIDRTLFDILPDLGVENNDNVAEKDTHDENPIDKNVDNDIPDDDELNELFQ